MEPFNILLVPQVKELGRYENQVALYSLTYPNGRQVWRIAKPTRHYSEIPTSLWSEFIQEKEARLTFAKLVNCTIP